MRRKFTQKEILSIINLYNNGKQQCEIAQQLFCAQTTISGILKRNNIKTRTGGNLKRKYQKYLEFISII